MAAQHAGKARMPGQVGRTFQYLGREDTVLAQALKAVSLKLHGAGDAVTARERS
jgi:hypothetical protein